MHEAFQKLCDYLSLKGVKVEVASDGENAFFPLTNTIRVNSKQNFNSRYYTLLHEIGHYLLRQENDFSEKYLEDVTRHSANKENRIDVLREEIVAWEKCLEFAEKNNFFVDKTQWKKYSKKYIYQYALWTVNPRYFQIDE